MTLKEKITGELDSFGEKELQQVETYVSFLKYQLRRNVRRDFNEVEAAALYKEFADEDRMLAEEGMADYARGLTDEDNK